MSDLRVGFIGLGNVGGQLAGNLLRHGVALTVRDLDPARVAGLVTRGASAAATPRALAEAVDVVITCLPSPAVSAEVMEAADGVLAGLSPGKIWLEMSTTDAAEVLEITEDNVKVRLHRARALLRKSLYARAGMERKEAFNFHAVRCDRVVKNVFERIQQRVAKIETSAAKIQ